MEPNPYEPPKGNQEEKNSRKTAVYIALSLLTVPAAAIAGGTTCTALTHINSFTKATPLTAVLGIAAAPVSLALAIGMLLAGNHFLRHSQRTAGPSYMVAILALLAATPIALLLMFCIGSFAVGQVMGERDANAGWPFILMAGTAAFFVLSLAFWIGPRRRHAGR